ncbi:unnamed protein product [Ascophyllum nodosum]
MLRSLRFMGVTEETTRAIVDEIAKKKTEGRGHDHDHALKQEMRELENNAERDGRVDSKSGHDDLREFARRQAADNPAKAGLGGNSSSIMAWGIVEGLTEKVGEAYRALVEFVASSWELYKAELESVTFPVFVHCYLTLVEAGYGEQATRLMKAWGGGHEATYREEVSHLRMLKAKDHLAASGYAQLVLKHKFRVRMCLAASKLLNAFLLNKELLIILNIVNTKISFVIADRPPLPFRQAREKIDIIERERKRETHTRVVRCGPDDVFPASLRRGVELNKAKKRKVQQPEDGEGEMEAEQQGNDEEGMKWAAAPPMEVALLKQTERDAVAVGLDYPLSANPGAPAVAAPAPVNANANAPGGGKGISRSGTTVAGGLVVLTGSEAAAKARERLKKLQEAAKVTEETAAQHGGLRQRQVTLPDKPPPLPDPPTNWSYLRLLLRPLNSKLLEDALRTPEGDAKPFLANPLTPHVAMFTCYNAHKMLCCIKPTRDGTQIAAGFTDRAVRAWRTAPNAPAPYDGENAKGAAGGGDGGSGGDALEPMRFVGHSRPVLAMSWSPDGRLLLSAGGDGFVKLWDLARGRSGNAAGYVRYDGHCGPVWDVAFGPTGYYFATASADRTACLWSTDSAQPLRIFAGHLDGVLCVAFHPNSNYVVTGSVDKTVRLWEIQSGNCIRLFAGQAGSVTCVAVSPCGRKIAAGSSDRSIRVWDIATGNTLALFKGHTDAVECMDFSAEGSALVSGGKDRMVMIWDVATACAGGSSKPLTDNGVPTPFFGSPERDREQPAVGTTAALGTKKRKRGLESWSSTGDGPSHGPVHTFATRNTEVYSVLFTKKNLVLAAGILHE